MLWRLARHRRLAVAWRLLLGALLFLAASGPARARLPLPHHGDRSVHDLAGVLDPASVALMERRHAELQRKSGAAIVVITVARLEDETLAGFAVRVGQEWGVGKGGGGPRHRHRRHVRRAARLRRDRLRCGGLSA